jgi:NAD+ kinase
MLCVRYGKTKPKEILTDIYLERGISAGCIRYSVSIDSKQKLKSLTMQKFTDYAIGSGVIISTSFGSAGYYNYLDRIKLNKLEGNKYMKGFEDNRVGICHIIPSFLIHESNEKNHRMYNWYIQYTVPIESIIKVWLVRRADARLYGTAYHSKGVTVDVNSHITICHSNRTAKIIKLNTQARVK